MTDPWADPSTPTEPGYTGPPPTVAPRGPGAGGPYGTGTAPPYGWAPRPYGGQPFYAPPPSFGYPGYGSPPPYGPPYGPGGHPGPPRGPVRPGQVVGAAVLTFVQAAIVLIASVYVWFFASVAGLAVDADPTSAPAAAHEFTRLGTTLSIVQVGSVILLVTGGVLALTRRTRVPLLVLVAAHAVQLALSVYWAVRLNDLIGPAAAATDGFGGVLAAFALFFSALPLVALGLVLLGSGRRWFTAPQG